MNRHDAHGPGPSGRARGAPRRSSVAVGAIRLIAGWPRMWGLPGVFALLMAGGAIASVTNTTGLRDIKPPVDIPNPWRWVACAAVATALGALAYALLRWWRRRRMSAAIVPPVPPHVRARQRLQAALGLLDQPKPFCIEVSETLRGYLEERFALHAPERTTEEFLVELQRTEHLTPPQKERLADFLARCDLVKFARYEPREPELRDLHEAAWRLVEETQPVPGLTETAAASPGHSNASPSAPSAPALVTAEPRPGPP